MALDPPFIGFPPIRSKPSAPYAPEDASNTPDERSVFFVGDGAGILRNNEVYEIREDLRDILGDTFLGYWESPTLSRDGTGEEMTLRTLTLYYSSSEDTAIEVDISGDGGTTYTETKEVNLIATEKEIRRIRFATNTTGYDLRFRIRFSRLAPALIYSYAPSLVRRGRLVV